MNCHPSIALGIERYKFVYGKHQEDVGPHLFESDRFFAFGGQETNVNPARLGHIDLFKKKFERAVYRGDKIPGVMRYRRILTDQFPKCRFIVLYRNVERVCSSWNQRARNPNDSWKSDQDFTAAVRAINKELRRAVRLREKQPGRCLIVRYENIFGPNGLDTMGAIVNWLKIEPHPQLMKALEMNRLKATQVERKPLLELAGQHDFIKEHIDWAVIEQAEAVAV
jgi:hypothetical protein